MQVLVGKIVTFIIDPLIALIFACGFLVFVWGIVQFMYGLSQQSEAKEEGKKHMLWGIIGITIMLSAWGILRIIAGTFNLPLS